MKTILALTAIALLPSLAQAATSCPRGFEVVYDCKSTPAEGDDETVAGSFEKIKVCRGNDGAAALIAIKDKESETLSAEVTDRMGGSSFVVRANTVTFEFSVTTGILSPVSPATLSIKTDAGNFSGSSTYSCNRK